MNKRVRAYYSGRVQGVGFRVTAEETATRLGVVGWVKNLRDGRVEVLGEAGQPVLEEFLEDVRVGPMKNFIRDVKVSWSAASNTFNEFEIYYL